MGILVALLAVGAIIGVIVYFDLAQSKAAKDKIDADLDQKLGDLKSKSAKKQKALLRSAAIHKRLGEIAVAIPAKSKANRKLLDKVNNWENEMENFKHARRLRRVFGSNAKCDYTLEQINAEIADAKSRQSAKEAELAALMKERKDLKTENRELKLITDRR